MSTDVRDQIRERRRREERDRRHAIRQSEVTDALDVQEAHSPTEEVPISVTIDRSGRSAKTLRCRARIVDARLWGAWTPRQRRAAGAIVAGFESLCRGRGFPSQVMTIRSELSELDPLPPALSPMERAQRQADLEMAYVEWGRRCQRDKIPHADIIAVLCYGSSPRQVDRQRSKRHGSTATDVQEGLSLYANLQGWLKGSDTRC